MRFKGHYAKGYEPAPQHTQRPESDSTQLDLLDPRIFIRGLPRSTQGWKAFASGGLAGAIWAALGYFGVRLLLSCFPEGSSSWVEAIAVVGTVIATSWIGLRQSREALERERLSKLEALKASAFSLYYILITIYSRQVTLDRGFKEARSRYDDHTSNVDTQAQELERQGIKVLSYFSQFFMPPGNLPSEMKFDAIHLESAFRFGGADLANSIGALDERYNGIISGLKTYSALWLETMKDMSGELNGEVATSFSTAIEAQKMQIKLVRLDSVSTPLESFIEANISDTYDALKMTLKNRSAYFKEAFSLQITSPSGEKVSWRWDKNGNEV